MLIFINISDTKMCIYTKKSESLNRYKDETILYVGNKNRFRNCDLLIESKYNILEKVTFILLNIGKQELTIF